MPSTLEFGEDNGAQLFGGNSIPSGTTRTIPRTETDWKNIDDSTTAYSSAPITAGNNSYNKYQWARWTGAYNQITTVTWQHTGGLFGAGITLFTVVTGYYTTPATTADSRLLDFSWTGLQSTGYTVIVGGTGVPHSGKGTSSTANPAYSPYLVTQMRTTAAASAGDTATAYLSLSWQEN